MDGAETTRDAGSQRPDMECSDLAGPRRIASTHEPADSGAVRLVTLRDVSWTPVAQASPRRDDRLRAFAKRAWASRTGLFLSNSSHREIGPPSATRRCGRTPTSRPRCTLLRGAQK